MSVSAPAASVRAAGSVRAAVNLLAIAALFSGAALRICDGLLPRLAADFGISTGTAGRAVLTFATAYGFAQLAYGPLADRYGKAKLVCSALFGCALAGLACAFAPGFDALLLLRIVWGVAAAGVIPLAMAWIGDTVPYEQRQATLARLLTGTLTGMMLGQLGGGLFADSAFGWRGAFLTLAAGYALVALLLLRKLRTLTALSPAAGSGHVGFLSQLTAVLGLPWVRVVLASVAAEGVFLLGPLSFLPAYLHQRFGLSVSAASALIALYAVGGLVYAMTARTIVRRFGERKMVLAGGLLMAAGFLAWYATPVAWLAAPVALLVGFGTYLFHNTLQTNATQMAPAARGTAMALFASSFFIGQAVGVSWAGAVFDRFGPAPLLLVPALALGLAGWGFARALRRRAAA